MPAKTAVPSVWRSSAPAPVAQTSGTTPRMNANDVIRIGRSRNRAASAAAAEAARLRLRPILMTSLAFILGVVPLVWATGAGAELRQTLGTAVFAGMIGVTIFGLIFTPVFYVISRWLAGLAERRKPAPVEHVQPAE